ncbi:MAG: hypothetical protein ACM33B_08675, partial [Pseudomonadota bacterium]
VMSTSDVAQLHRHRVHANAWLVAVVVLAAAVVALVGWILLDSDPAPPKGLASDAISSMLAQRIAAFNSDGRQDMSRFYAPNAILEEHDVSPSVVTRGSTAIGERLEGISRLWNTYGVQIASQSDAIRFGPYVAEASSIGEGWDGILVYRLDENRKIEHQWVIGP